MARCGTCSRWWSVLVGEIYRDTVLVKRIVPGEEICPCGGALELVDMAAHYKTLDHVPYDPSKDPRLKK
jgi:hypothetical protein